MDAFAATSSSGQTTTNYQAVTTDELTRYAKYIPLAKFHLIRRYHYGFGHSNVIDFAKAARHAEELRRTPGGAVFGTALVAIYLQQAVGMARNEVTAHDVRGEYNIQRELVRAASEGNNFAKNLLGQILMHEAARIQSNPDETPHLFGFRQLAWHDVSGRRQARQETKGLIRIPLQPEERVNLAASLFREVADKGLSDAARNLGRCFEHGAGVQERPDLAVQQYEAAAKHSHAGAQFDLGVLLLKGATAGKYQVPQDINRGREWLTAAKEQGYPVPEKYFAVRGESNTPTLPVEGFHAV